MRDVATLMEQRQFSDIKGMLMGDSARLKALFSQEFQYDNNIFLTSSDKQSDLISVTGAKLLLDVPLGLEERHLIQLIYGADAALFSDYKSQNYVNQDLTAIANLRLPFGYLDFRNDLTDTESRADTEFTSQTRRRVNRSDVRLGVELNKLSYELGYAHLLTDYRERQFDTLNYTEDILSGTAFYQLRPKTKALLEYDHGVINYSKDATRDGDYDQLLGGFVWDITGKTTGVAKAGYQDRSYETAGQAGFSSLVAETGLLTKFTERTELELRYRRDAIESIDATNNYYDLNSFFLGLTQRLRGRYSVLISTQADVRDYPEADPAAGKKRHDTVLTDGITLRYDVKTWGRADLGYRYTGDISNIDSNSYNDNIVFFNFNFLI